MSFLKTQLLIPRVIKAAKCVLTIAITLGCISSYSQNGIKGGINFATLRGNDADGFKGITSFHLGLVKEVSVFDNFSLQGELLYSGQGAETRDDEYKLNYINIPVVGEFYLNNSFSFQIGPQAGFLISHTDDFEPADPDFFDFGFVAGVEFLTTEGLFIQGRYNWSTTPLFEDYDVKNSVVQISIGYMF